jgi:hypothetical protein
MGEGARRAGEGGALSPFQEESAVEKSSEQPLRVAGFERMNRTFMGWIALILLTFIALPTPAMAPAEKAKVEHLLAYVAGLEGCAFIRNGQEYDAKKASEHIRGKYERVSDRLKDARDFVEKCASRSLISGEEYKVRFADGTVRPCRDVLLEELARYEKNQKQDSPQRR